ncbi:MAG: L-rhamnose isomerase [Planctomycetota bacterium]
MKNIKRNYALAKERYAELAVNTEQAIKTLSRVSVSLQCWQGDDVGGFEKPGTALSGDGIQVTGNYPGKARTVEELRADLEKVFSLLPGRHRLNLHALYGEFVNKPVARDQIGPEHFKGWIDWAKRNHLKLDFNATCFSHQKAETGFTLSSRDKEIRKFWVEHVKRCRKIAALMGKSQNSPCIHNLWIPDGSKDLPADRWTHRQLLKESLDEIFAIKYHRKYLKDSLESKLFGIGSESYVVGSHEFYLSYAIKNGLIVCLDLGHFHPTESVADKISAILQFSNELLLHLSRGVRWDSDHVVILNDEIRSVMEEIVRGDALKKVHLALDFFDASINRVGAWVIGARAVLKALLIALLEPQALLKKFENEKNNLTRLGLMEEAKTLPFGAVWDYYCLKNNVPAEADWLKEVQAYEKKVTGKRL